MDSYPCHLLCSTQFLRSAFNIICSHNTFWCAWYIAQTGGHRPSSAPDFSCIVRISRSAGQPSLLSLGDEVVPDLYGVKHWLFYRLPTASHCVGIIRIEFASTTSLKSGLRGTFQTYWGAPTSLHYFINFWRFFVMIHCRTWPRCDIFTWLSEDVFLTFYSLLSSH